jgi:hypothetical protein
MSSKVLDHNPDSRTRSVKIAGQPFEIPAHMDAAGMVECWQEDSAALEQAAGAIVNGSPKFARQIVSAWAQKYGYYLVPRPECQRPA